MVAAGNIVWCAARFTSSTPCTLTQENTICYHAALHTHARRSHPLSLFDVRSAHHTNAMVQTWGESYAEVSAVIQVVSHLHQKKKIIKILLSSFFVLFLSPPTSRQTMPYVHPLLPPFFVLFLSLPGTKPCHMYPPPARPLPLPL